MILKANFMVSDVNTKSRKRKQSSWTRQPAARGSMTEFSRVCQPAVISSAEVSVIAKSARNSYSKLYPFSFVIKFTFAQKYRSYLALSAIFALHLCIILVTFVYTPRRWLCHAYKFTTSRSCHHFVNYFYIMM